MTSPDGINWTIRTSAADNEWRAVTYGNGLFVALSQTGTSNRVMTSPDGINWTIRTSAADNSWFSVTYSNGIFAAVAASGTSNRVMTSGSFIVLPVELIGFTGQNREGSNLLTWQTANEVNNKGFQVERLHGNTWQNIGFVTAKGKEAMYDFTDNTPLSTTYYRLRQIDNDGKETFSKVISIAIPSTWDNNKLKLYPNPVSNVLTVKRNAVPFTTNDYQILNLLGQQVLTGKAAPQVDVSALPQGTYFLKMGTEQVKFVKQ